MTTPLFLGPLTPIVLLLIPVTIVVLIAYAVYKLLT